jgi:hypothetical protein
LSWYRPNDRFPEAKDIKEHVEGGWDGKNITVEWNMNGEYDAIVKVVKDVAERDEVQVYTVGGCEEKLSLFVLAPLASKQWVSQYRESKIHCEDDKLSHAN